MCFDSKYRKWFPLNCNNKWKGKRVNNKQFRKWNECAFKKMEILFRNRFFFFLRPAHFFQFTDLELDIYNTFLIPLLKDSRGPDFEHLLMKVKKNIQNMSCNWLNILDSQYFNISIFLIQFLRKAHKLYSS